MLELGGLDPDAGSWILDPGILELGDLDPGAWILFWILNRGSWIPHPVLDPGSEILERGGLDLGSRILDLDSWIVDPVLDLGSWIVEHVLDPGSWGLDPGPCNWVLETGDLDPGSGILDPAGCNP